MTLRKRRILFSALVLIFFIASPAIILYSLGYKLDIKTLTVQKTGGIFIDADYDKYQININDKISKEVIRSAFFARGTLAPNLMPKSYKVEIKKENFEPWQKYLEVKSGLVTEVKNVFLMPQNKEPVLNADGAVDFVFSKPEEKIGYLAKNEIAILNTTDNIVENKISLPKNSQNLKLLGFSSNNKNLYFRNNTSLFKTLYETNNIAEIKIPTKIKYAKISINPKDENILYALSDKNSLYEINFKENSQKVFLENVLYFAENGDSLFYATKEPVNFYKRKINAEKSDQLTSTPVKNFDAQSKIEPIFDDTLAIIDQSGDLYLYYAYLKKFQKLASGIKNVKASGDLSKILYYSENEMYVYYISPSYPNKNPGETDLIGRFRDKIQDAKWFLHDNHHLLFKIADDLKIIELDGRDKRNSYDIVKNASDFKFNNIDKSVYYLKDNKLHKIILMAK